MKKIILFVALCHVHLNIFSQYVDSLIDIKGYYVTIFSKQEIVFFYEQKLKREKEESYSVPIDYKSFSFFIPLQVGNKTVCAKNMVTEKFLNYRQGDSIYFFPNNSHKRSVLGKIDDVKIDFLKETCILSDAMRLSPYYEIRGNNSSLFNCTYIEGYARHKHIQEIKKEWQGYLLNICSIDKEKKNAEFFFIVKINNYTPYIKIPKLNKWLPYLD